MRSETCKLLWNIYVGVLWLNPKKKKKKETNQQNLIVLDVQKCVEANLSRCRSPSVQHQLAELTQAYF